MKFIQNKKLFLARYQNGSSLLVVLVVLLVLSIVSVASIDSTNIQSSMTRNNQMRLEAFNTSMVEIEGQLDLYESFGAASIPTDILALLDTSVDTKISSEASSTPQMVIQSIDSSFEKSTELTNSGGCPVYGSSLGVVSSGGSQQCILLRLSSEATHNNFSIGSDQRQTFGYIYQ